MRSSRTALAALAGAALFVGGGSALAAQDAGDRAARCEARLAKLAEKRGVSVDVLKARMTARVDAALANGRISAPRAAKLKERIAQSAICRPLGVHVQVAKRGMLHAAAGFLGLSARELRAELPATSLARSPSSSATSTLSRTR